MEYLDKIVGELRPVGEPGSATVPLLRLTGADYEDGVSAPREGVNAADIAQNLFAQNGADIPNSLGLNEMWVTWGQFLDHDIDLTPDSAPEVIQVDGLIAPVTRSIFDGTTGTGTDNPREQVNVITPLIDASNVYGSDSARLEALRSFDGGKLKTSEGMDGVDFLPLNTFGLANGGDNDPADPLFVAGDVRANENVALTAMHTVFVNEHNHWAEHLAEKYPGWSDEEIFQSARAIVEAISQKITFDEYLPHLLGDGALPPPAASADGIDPGITNEFSTVAFRFGHSMVSPFQTRIEEDGADSAAGDLAVQDAFFDNTAINDAGIASLLRGISETVAQELDTKMIDDLNFFLANPGGTVGFSLAALNIVRGRDHGLPSYVEARAELLGDIDPSSLDPADFSIITADAAVQAQLAAVYGSVLEVDLWVGGLAEGHVDGAAVGPLFHFILAEQFARLRDADPLWYEDRTWLDEDLLEAIEQTSLADVLMRSGGVDYLQRDAFLASERTGGTNGKDKLTGDEGRDLMIGFGGDDRIRGEGGDDDLFGANGRDRLFGGAGDDGLTGGRGRDTLFGEDGDDELSGDGGRDRLFGGDGNDTLNGGDGRDTLRGDDGDDLVLGDDGRDRLFGDDGNDTLNGGDGGDTLRGGDGADEFVIDADDRGIDWIKDFTQGQDLLVLDGFGATLDDITIKMQGKTAVLKADGAAFARVQGDFDTLDDADFALFM